MKTKKTPIPTEDIYWPGPKPKLAADPDPLEKVMDEKLEEHRIAGEASAEITRAQLTTAEKSLAFIFSGNAYFTLQSKKTGTRYTYRVSKAKNNTGNWGRTETFFVSLLTGPDNISSYTYLGIIRDQKFQLTKASKMQSDSMPVCAFDWTLALLVTTKTLPPSLEIWHEGRCGRCGRKLTVPESIAAGIGPECAGRM